MKLIDYLIAYSKTEFDKKEIEKILKKASKDLIKEINSKANGKRKYIAYVITTVKEFFGGIS